MEWVQKAKQSCLDALQALLVLMPRRGLAQT